MAFAGFGQQPAPAVSFGGFGASTQANTTGGAFSFGSTPQQAPAFGATTGTGFSFGAAQPATSNVGFSFGSNAAQPAQQQSSLFGSTNTFGAPASSAPPAFGTGTTGFNWGSTSTSTTTSAPTFSFGSNTLTGATPGFSFGQPSSGGLFSANKPFSLSLPGQQPLTLPGFGAQPIQQQQQQQQVTVDDSTAFHQSLFGVTKFGDERDSILANLNFVMASWGFGRGYYHPALPPVLYTPSNPFYRFKAVGYSYFYPDSNEDGHVLLLVKRPQDKAKAEEKNLLQTINNIMGRQNLASKVIGSKKSGEDFTQVVVVAEDTTTLRRVPATDLSGLLNQLHVKGQLDAVGVSAATPKVRPSPAQLASYLDNAPDGIDPRVWKKAQEDNPDSTHMIPVSIVGPSALNSRIKWQESEATQHSERLKLLEDKIEKVHVKSSNISAELSELRRRHVEFTQRILNVVVRQEMARRSGTLMSPEEEHLRRRVNAIEKALHNPGDVRGQLLEAISRIHLSEGADGRGGGPSYSIDPNSLVSVTKALSLQQASLRALLRSTKEDMETLSKINASLTNISSKPHHLH